MSARRREERRRIGRQIRAAEVRVLDADGNHLGVKSLREALEMADDAGLSLVEIAAGDPPVCRICDPGKLAYEEAKARRAAGKPKQVRTREVKLRPQTDDGDYRTKLGHIRRFLADGDRVSVVIMLRGRQLSRDGDADVICERLVADLGDQHQIDGPRRAGRDVRMMVTPGR